MHSDRGVIAMMSTLAVAGGILAIQVYAMMPLWLFMALVTPTIAIGFFLTNAWEEQAKAECRRRCYERRYGARIKMGSLSSDGTPEEVPYRETTTKDTP